ncbi:IGR protein motif family protein [Aspergillus niger]|uniref:Stress-associated endoplasmic reticulum protein n=2 Tax=Aspergillus niger TaxID=5061 RepID=A0A505HXF4_ASPNG|nr:IGR protein motif family protein [Aspergillus niger]
MVAQTPQQRKANERFAKQESAKRGKGKTVAKSKQTPRSPVSTVWVAILAFVVCGGIFLEILGIIPKLWSTMVASINRLML